jgi:hypothetical protein
MDLILTPDVYEPSIDANGNYVDKLPPWSPLKGKGILCDCGSRKDKVYETLSSFTSHIKTNKHKQWVEGLNANKVNWYMENMKLKRLVTEQRHIIGRYEVDVAKLKQKHEIEISNKQQTIDCLTQLLSEMNDKPNTYPDLMNI